MTVQANTQLEQQAPEHHLDIALKLGYRVQVSYELEDRAWDSFLAQTPGGHHEQTSLWAEVKALSNWRAMRIIVRQDKQIVAGVQILLRSIPFSNAIGLVLKAPLFAVDDPLLTKLVIEELHYLARIHRIQYLVMQPPYNGETFARQLPNWGFQLSPIEVAHSATLLYDLSPSLDDIFASMPGKTRYKIRSGKRKGITVREGGISDLPTFYQLHTLTCQRQHITPYSEEHVFTLWSTFAPHGYIRLFLAEYEGEVVSTRLVIPFGDTVLFKMRGWSGHHGNRLPNEVLHWETVTWAKSQGYRYCDVDGIDVEVARAIVHGRALSEENVPNWTMFKLKFGGQVTLLPEIHQYIYNPLLRWGYTKLSPRITDWSMLGTALGYLRTSWLGNSYKKRTGGTV